MKGNKGFYVAEISQFAAEYYLKSMVSRPLVFFGNPKDYELVGYNLTELAVMARFDNRAKNELLWRIHRQVLNSVKALSAAKPYINFDETCAYVFQQCAGMIQAYDQRMGTFESFLRHCIFLYVKQCNIHQAVQYKRHLNNLGKRIQEANMDCLYDSGSYNPAKRIIMRTDIETFESRLDFPDNEIFMLYLERMTYREIADIVKMPVSTVCYRIRALLERFDLMLHIKRKED